MTDPNYEHEFDPNRHGKCKVIIGAEICHLPEDAPVHQRYAERHPPPPTLHCPYCHERLVPLPDEDGEGGVGVLVHQSSGITVEACYDAFYPDGMLPTEPERTDA